MILTIGLIINLYLVYLIVARVHRVELVTVLLYRVSSIFFAVYLVYLYAWPLDDITNAFLFFDGLYYYDPSLRSIEVLFISFVIILNIFLSSSSSIYIKKEVPL
jgi:hypothetical protein